MENITPAEMVGAVLVANVLSLQVVFVFWKAAKNQFEAWHALGLILPLAAVAAAFM